MVKTKVDELREALAKRGERQDAAEAIEASSEADAAAVVPEAPAPSEREIQLQQQLEATQSQLADFEDRLRRVAAESDNFRKRAERDKTDAITFANDRLLGEMLPVLDHLDEALARVPADNCSPELQSFAEGVELTMRQCVSVLAKFGLEEIPAEPGRPFDPSVHEAVSQIEVEDTPSNVIAIRHRRGYTLHGRVLRAALVVVAK